MSGAEAQVWEIPVLLTVAQEGEGIDELLMALDAHVDWLERSGELSERRRQRLLERVRAVVDRGLRTRVWREGEGEAILKRARSDLEAGRRTPYDVADEILSALGPGGSKG